MDLVLLKVMSGVPHTEIDLANLQRGETVVVMVDDRHRNDRTLEITVTITAFTLRVTGPFADENPAVWADRADVRRIRFAHVSIARMWGEDQECPEEDANYEFGALAPHSEIRVGDNWLLNIGDHSITEYRVRSITLFR